MDKKNCRRNCKTGKPVEGFHIERSGDIQTIMKASKKAQEFSMWASEKLREECPMSDLWISVKCGEVRHNIWISF